MVSVIKNLQQQCDVHATKILNLFSQDTGMLKIVRHPLGWKYAHDITLEFVD